MIGVTITRRFRLDGQLVELSHLAELPALPAKGWQIDYADNSGFGTVAWARITLRDFSPGAHAPAITIHMESEAGERLEPARAAGWKPVEGV